MPKIIRPYYGDAAYGKNGSSPSSLIYARTSGNVESNKMVTYTKGYKAPIQPDTALQLAVRDKMRQLTASLKAFSPLYVPGSLFGTLPVPESSFKSGRSKYFSICLRLGIHFMMMFATLDISENKLKMRFLSDALFNAYFSLDSIRYAVQIRGTETNQYFYRSTDKFQYVDLDVNDDYLDREVNYNDAYFNLVADEDDFKDGDDYQGRLWFSLVDFPAAPTDPLIDATNTWDIGNSVRSDFIFTKSA